MVTVQLLLEFDSQDIANPTVSANLVEILVRFARVDGNGVA